MLHGLKSYEANMEQRNDLFTSGILSAITFFELYKRGYENMTLSWHHFILYTESFDAPLNKKKRYSKNKCYFEIKC